MEKATTGKLEIGAPVMGLESSGGEDAGTVLAGDPIPPPPQLAVPTGAVSLASVMVALCSLVAFLM